MNRIVLLGTGCPSPSHIRYGPSTLISTERLKILIDAGSGVTQRLSEFGLAPSEIDIILITHLHSDHIVDLYQLYISGWHTGRTKPFKIIGPKGIKNFFDKNLRTCFEILKVLPFYPSSSDGGFSVTDHKNVNKDLGTWHDIRSLSNHASIMADLILNHSSIKGKWFNSFIKEKEDYKNVS